MNGLSAGAASAPPSTPPDAPDVPEEEPEVPEDEPEVPDAPELLSPPSGLAPVTSVSEAPPQAATSATRESTDATPSDKKGLMTPW